MFAKSINTVNDQKIKREIYSKKKTYTTLIKRVNCLCAKKNALRLFGVNFMYHEKKVNKFII